MLDDDAREYFSYVKSSKKHMQILIESLLKYSKTGSNATDFEQINLNEVVTEVLDNLERVIEEYDANIEMSSLPIIKADKLQIAQLFQNLIVNAIKYRSAMKPSIQIRHHIKNDRCLITIKDNGLGIPENNKDSVFKMFSRLHSDQAEGVGLGLAICKKIVSNHHGEIWVESKVGAGSTFFLHCKCLQNNIFILYTS